MFALGKKNLKIKNKIKKKLIFFRLNSDFPIKEL